MTTSKNQNHKDLITLTNENIELLNGYYSNIRHIPPVDEYEDLFSIKHRRTKERIGEHYTSLKVLNLKKIRVDIHKGDSLINTYKLRGKIKNGYFELKRKYFFLPAIIITGFGSSKFRLGILKNQTLVTDSKEIDFGLVYFIYPFLNVHNYDNIEYHKYNQKL